MKQDTALFEDSTAAQQITYLYDNPTVGRLAGSGIICLLTISKISITILTVPG